MDDIVERIYESDALFLEKYAALDEAVRRQRVRWERLMREKQDRIAELETSLDAASKSIEALRRELELSRRNSDRLQKEATADVQARQQHLDRASTTISQREAAIEQKMEHLRSLELEIAERLSAVESRETLVERREKALDAQRAEFEAQMAPSKEEIAATKQRLAGFEGRMEKWKDELKKQEEAFELRRKQEESMAAVLRQERDMEFMEQRCRLRAVKDEIEERELVLSARQVHAAQFELRLQELERQHNTAIEEISRRHHEEREKQQQHLEQRFKALATEREALARERSAFLSERTEYLTVLQHQEASGDSDEPLVRMRKVQSLMHHAFSAASSSSGPAAVSSPAGSSFAEPQLESTILSTTDDNRSGVKLYSRRSGTTTIVRSPLSSEKKKQSISQKENRDTDLWLSGTQKQLTFA